MKTKILLSVIILGAFFGIRVEAQAPIFSTAENPVWQYIQVIGMDDSADRMFTVEEDETVHGRPFYAGLDRSEVDKQLWRFERLTSTSYLIINKATGKKLDISYDAALRIRIATVSEVPSTNWRFQKTTDYYNMRAITEPTTGTAGNNLAFQTNGSITRRDYIIMFEASDKRTNDNALFKFLSFGTNLPEESKGNKEPWYFILSSKNGLTNQCITSIANPTDPYIKFTLATKEPNNENQYWKFIKKNNDPTDYRYDIQNKGTGEIISTKVILDRYFYVQNTNQPDENEGWQLNILADEQYELFGKDGQVLRYLNASSTEEKSETYIGKSQNTGFAWSFEYIEGGTSIKLPETNINDIIVYSENKRIYIEGAENYTVRNIYGSLVNKEGTLETGIYLVTINGETRKVLVK